MIDSNWYITNDADVIDSPALLVYPRRIEQNIATLLSMIDSPARLRPHIKTHKSASVTRMMLAHGITKFKCATIAEAEMLATVGATDVLLAYQPVGPKANRLLSLVRNYSGARFCTLVDNAETARNLSGLFLEAGLVLPVYIDLNIGMNRTGIAPQKAVDLANDIIGQKGVQLCGIHAYDGHLRDEDFSEPKRKCDERFLNASFLKTELESLTGRKLSIVAGGSPTFPIHAMRTGIECSPGTFIYWDSGYAAILPEQKFVHAAILLCRVVSSIDDDHVCADLGHKAVASENPLDKRVTFLNAPALRPVSQSEEHLVLSGNKTARLKVGDVLYGLPYHVCPTVALYDRVLSVENGAVAGQWTNAARSRQLTV